MSSRKDNSGCLIVPIILIIIGVLMGKQESSESNDYKNEDQSSWLYADSIATIQMYSLYIYNNPNGKYVDKAREKIEKIEQIQEQEEYRLYWNTEKKAWHRAISVFDYEKYLSHYPTGEHAIEAEKRIVDGEIKRIMQGQYSSLPDMKRSYNNSSSNESTSLITIVNNTSFNLTVYYSGIDSKRVKLSSHQSTTISLKNGNYRIAASVDAHNVSKYAGSKYLSGDYNTSYYIETRRY